MRSQAYCQMIFTDHQQLTSSMYLVIYACWWPRKLDRGSRILTTYSTVIYSVIRFCNWISVFVMKTIFSLWLMFYFDSDIILQQFYRCSLFCIDWSWSCWSVVARTVLQKYCTELTRVLYNSVPTLLQDRMLTSHRCILSTDDCFLFYRTIEYS